MAKLGNGSLFASLPMMFVLKSARAVASKAVGAALSLGEAMKASSAALEAVPKLLNS